MRKAVTYLMRRAFQLFMWAVRKTWPKAKHSWRKGLGKPNSWIYVVAALFLFPYLTYYAFSYSWQYGLFFLMTGAVAIYYGYIFANPGMLIVAYVGVVLGSEATKLFFTARDIALGGEFLPALVLVGVAAFLTLKAQSMKTGQIVEDSASVPRRRHRKHRLQH